MTPTTPTQSELLAENQRLRAALAAAGRDHAGLLVENDHLRRQLSEAAALHAQQAATAAVLRSMRRIGADPASVLEVIAASAAQLTESDRTFIHLITENGERLRVVAAVNTVDGGRFVISEVGRDVLRRRLSPGGVHDPVWLDGAREFFRPVGRQEHAGDPLVPTWAAARAVLERRTIHIEDIERESDEEFGESKRRAKLPSTGFRTVLAVPLLREHAALGVISVNQRSVRPYSAQQVRVLEAFADQAAVAVENAQLFQVLRERDERRRAELERASAIQQRLLPERVEGWPGLLEVAVRFRPAVETSGDFYDVFRLAPSTAGTVPPLQLAVGDVAGKGMSAALVTALARSALRTTAGVPIGMATPAGTLRTAGQRLHEDVGGQHFVACALAVVEPPGQENAGPFLRLANAAQVPVMLVRGGRVRELVPPGNRLPLGTQADGRYGDLTTELRPGDVVVFSSDGLAEAPARVAGAAPEHLPPAFEAGELFGFERLATSVAYWARRAGSAEGVAEGIWADLTAWADEETHHDDMTLLVLRVPR